MRLNHWRRRVRVGPRCWSLQFSLSAFDCIRRSGIWRLDPSCSERVLIAWSAPRALSCTSMQLIPSSMHQTTHRASCRWSTKTSSLWPEIPTAVRGLKGLDVNSAFDESQHKTATELHAFLHSLHFFCTQCSALPLPLRFASTENSFKTRHFSPKRVLLFFIIFFFELVKNCGNLQLNVELIRGKD